jgi:predicted RNA-binding Zn-ribbon protein involved in translation (DUF1610 family)
MMPQPVCRICARPLRDEKSTATGVGPRCATQARNRGHAPRLFQAEYFCEYLEGALFIFDRACGSLSVANDLDRILLEEACVRASLPAVVIYRDEIGAYRQVLHRDGVFGGVLQPPVATLANALKLARERVS